MYRPPLSPHMIANAESLYLFLSLRSSLPSALLPAAFDGDVLYIQRLRRILQRLADVMDRRERER